MGCNSSTMRCTPGQKEEVFRLAVVELLLLSAQTAVKRVGESAKIQPPVTRHQGSTSSLDSRRSQDSGILLGKARGFARSASETALKVIVDGLEVSLAAMAPALSHAARNIVASKQEEITAVLSTVIHFFRPKSSVFLVRGPYPHGPAEYKATKSDSITGAFMTAAANKLVEKLVPIVKPEVEHHFLTKGMVDGLNNAANMVTQTQVPAQDLAKHVSAQLVDQIADVMAQEEAHLRKNPANKSRRPQTFEFCFSPDTDLKYGLALKVYQDRDV